MNNICIRSIVKHIYNTDITPLCWTVMESYISWSGVYKSIFDFLHPMQAVVHSRLSIMGRFITIIAFHVMMYRYRTGAAHYIPLISKHADIFSWPFHPASTSLLTYDCDSIQPTTDLCEHTHYGCQGNSINYILCPTWKQFLAFLFYANELRSLSLSLFTVWPPAVPIASFSSTERHWLSWNVSKKFTLNCIFKAYYFPTVSAAILHFKPHSVLALEESD